MSRLTCPIQTLRPSNVYGVSQNRAWMRSFIVDRAFCTTKSSGRLNTYSGLTGEVRNASRNKNARAVCIALATLSVLARCHPRATKGTIGSCWLSMMTRLSGSPLRVPLAFVVQQGCSANNARKGSSWRSSMLLPG